MNKNLSISLLLLATSLCVHAQDTTIVIGQRAEGGDIQVNATHFNTNIYTFSATPDLNNVCLFFRESTKNGKYYKNIGKIGLYKTAERKLKWEKKINYQSKQAVCTNKGVLTSCGGSNEMLSLGDGHTLWENFSYLSKVIDSLNVVISYGDAFSSKMRAVNLDTGTDVWKVKFDHDYGCSSTMPLIHNRQLMVADNLYDMNLATGESRSCELKTGVTDVKAVVLRGLAALAGSVASLGISGGAYSTMFLPTGNNVIANLCSNICRSDTLYYIADHEKMLAVDTLMHPVWQTEIPDKMASASKLAIMGDRLGLLNMGYGLKNGRYPTEKGLPFIAAYDIKSGKQIFLKTLYEGKHIVNDAFAADDGFFMFSDSIVSYLGIRDTTVAVQKDWDTAKQGKPGEFIVDAVYVNGTDAESFVPVCSNASQCALFSDNGHVYVMDKSLNIVSDYTADDVFFNVTRGDGFRLIANHLYRWIINDAGKAVAQMNPIRIAHAEGNSLLVLTKDNCVALINPIIK